MPFFNTLLTWITNPGTTVATGATEGGDDIPDGGTLGEVIVNAERENGEFIKRGLQELRPTIGGTPAYISVYKYSVVPGGVLPQLDQVQVQVGGVPLTEYKFLILQHQLIHTEKFSIMGTFGKDPDFVMSFGEEPRIWTFSGLLRNESGQGDWFRAFTSLYTNRLRASLMMESQEFVRLRLGKLVMDGYILNLTVGQDSQSDDAQVGFNFNMYIRKYDMHHRPNWTQLLNKSD